MFYVISQIYCGPNKNSRAPSDANTIQIWSKPAQKNQIWPKPYPKKLSKEVYLEGLFWTADNWSLFAHGEFATFEEARAYIAKNWGGDEFNDVVSEQFYGLKKDVVAVFSIDQHPKMPIDKTRAPLDGGTPRARGMPSFFHFGLFGYPFILGRYK